LLKLFQPTSAWMSFLDRDEKLEAERRKDK